MKRLGLLFVLLLGACGPEEKCGTAPGQTACKSDVASEPAEVPATNFQLRGSVTSVFEVNVDDKSYPDLESYFSAESANLPAKVLAAGFEGYTARFDAQLGYRDLYIGMYVFVQGANGRGYQSQTIIARDGTFSFSLPSDAAGDTYKIKASKRVSVYIAKGEEVKKFCWNFSATDLDVPYTEKDKPIIISTFKSTLTAYECQQDKGSESLEIPANSEKPKEVQKVEVTAAPVINNDYREIIFTGGSYWFPGTDSGVLCPGSSLTTHLIDYSYASGFCEKKLSDDGKDCSIGIGWVTASGATVVYQEGIRLEYLKVGAVWQSKADTCAAL